jgi:hypothetical protein
MDNDEALEVDDIPEPEFFSRRGIPDEIWQSRPYVWWKRTDTEPATAPFADLLGHQRTQVSKIVNQAPGYVITRYAVPLDAPLPKVYPELRPAWAVKTQGPKTHWRGDGAPPADLEWWEKMPGDRSNWQAHIDRAKTLDDHRGINTEGTTSAPADSQIRFPAVSANGGRLPSRSLRSVGDDRGEPASVPTPYSRRAEQTRGRSPRNRRGRSALALLSREGPERARDRKAPRLSPAGCTAAQRPLGRFLYHRGLRQSRCRARRWRRGFLRSIGQPFTVSNKKGTPHTLGAPLRECARVKRLSLVTLRARIRIRAVEPEKFCGWSARLFRRPGQGNDRDRPLLRGCGRRGCMRSM